MPDKGRRHESFTLFIISLIECELLDVAFLVGTIHNHPLTPVPHFEELVREGNPGFRVQLDFGDAIMSELADGESARIFTISDEHFLLVVGGVPDAVIAVDINGVDPIKADSHSKFFIFYL